MTFLPGMRMFWNIGLEQSLIRHAGRPLTLSGSSTVQYRAFSPLSRPPPPPITLSYPATRPISLAFKFGSKKGPAKPLIWQVWLFLIIFVAQLWIGKY